MTMVRLVYHDRLSTGSHILKSKMVEPLNSHNIVPLSSVLEFQGPGRTREAPLTTRNLVSLGKLETSIVTREDLRKKSKWHIFLGFSISRHVIRGSLSCLFIIPLATHNLPYYR